MTQPNSTTPDGHDAQSSESSTSSNPTTDTRTPDSVTDQPAGTVEGAAAEQDSENGTSDTFPRSYVEKLRRESAGYREQAGSATKFAQRLHTELVRATGRLADPSDLPFDAQHLEDDAALGNAIDALLARKPHLSSRRPTGDIGQGASGSGSPVDLAGLLRARA